MVRWLITWGRQTEHKSSRLSLSGIFPRGAASDSCVGFYFEGKMIRETFDFHSFWDFVNTSDGCWVWQGSVATGGYGRFYDGATGQRTLAHRLSYEIHFGNLPDDLVVHHKCNNKACVNPSHLEACTFAENIKYAAIDGLMGKSTVDNLQEIISLADAGWSQKEIARKYGISRQALYSITKGHRSGNRGIDISRPSGNVQYVNCSKAAVELGVTKQFVNVMVWQGKFKGAVRRLGRWYIPIESVTEIKNIRLNSKNIN